jgi:hypothetical protein
VRRPTAKTATLDAASDVDAVAIETGLPDGEDPVSPADRRKVLNLLRPRRAFAGDPL